MRKMLYLQGVLRHSDDEIMEAARRDWQAILPLMGDRPFFFGAEPTGVDAVLFGTLATSLLTPVPSPVRDFLKAQPILVAYTERMKARFFPELATA
jgi:glutathione S-transferase